ncbi:hypothetical protein SAMN04490197_4690 [Pseudomonas orientalis]|uniref:Uncharacterized protein n=2 Tax=Pseudomonas orientalis TaxID=76758 RepID=A0A8B3Y590_9PSED|nr:hypothetical protein SAMN04490197_4690 [Pseudomonas orientalis]
MGGRGETDLDTWQAHRFINTLLDEYRLDTEYRVDFDDDDEMTEHLYGKLEQLRVQSGQSTQDFIAWIRAANWTDEPASN